MCRGEHVSRQGTIGSLMFEDGLAVCGMLHKQEHDIAGFAQHICEQHLATLGIGESCL